MSVGLSHPGAGGGVSDDEIGATLPRDEAACCRPSVDAMLERPIGARGV